MLGRCRRIPFTTRRPTNSEIKRVLRILLTVYKGTAAAEPAQQHAAATRPMTMKHVSVPQTAHQQQLELLEPLVPPSLQQPDEVTPSPEEAEAAMQPAAHRKKSKRQAKHKGKQKTESNKDREPPDSSMQQADVDELISIAAAAVTAAGSRARYNERGSGRL